MILQQIWDEYNASVFQGKLLPVRFLSSPSSTNPNLFSVFDFKDRFIWIPSEMLEDEFCVRYLLSHEMCHQAVLDIDKAPTSEIYIKGGHGPRFRYWMEKTEFNYDNPTFALTCGQKIWKGTPLEESCTRSISQITPLIEQGHFPVSKDGCIPGDLIFVFDVSGDVRYGRALGIFGDVIKVAYYVGEELMVEAYVEWMVWKSKTDSQKSSSLAAIPDSHFLGLLADSDSNQASFGQRSVPIH